MLISVHIPKTAGTSFGNSLGNLFGNRLLLAYQTQPRLYSELSVRLSWARCKLHQIVRTVKIPRRYDAIHGHFFADAFNHLPVSKRYCVFMRDPAERVISHYLSWQEQYLQPGREAPKPPKRSLLTQMIENRMSLVDFASTFGMVNFYSVFLAGMPFEKFDFVGLMEDYPTSLKLFEKIFGLKMEEKRLNVINRKPYAEMLSSVDMERIKLAQSANARIYDQARHRFDQLCSRYL